MSPIAIFLIGVIATALIVVFLYVSVHEVRRGEGVAAAGSELPAWADAPAPPAPRSAGAMRVLVAIDGSPCTARVLDAVVARPWPADSAIEVLTVIHTNVPAVPDVFLAGAAAHVAALEEDRAHAPGRLRAAEDRLAGLAGITRTSAMLEGDPAKEIVAEADRQHADLIVVGSHGHGRVERLTLGSVSQAVADRAPCSVEIVRCRENAPAAI